MPDPQLYNEKELLAGLSKGKQVAYSTLYNLYVNQLFYFVQGIIKNQTAAEDIVSECFIKAWRKGGGFDSLSALKSYLMITGKNAAIDFLRSQAGHARSHLEISYLSSLSGKDVEEIYIASELLQRIYLEIEQLPAQCKQVIKLSLLEGKSIEEIAGILDIAYKSVQNQKTKGMKLLRNALLNSELLSVFLAAW